MSILKYVAGWIILTISTYFIAKSQNVVNPIRLAIFIASMLMSIFSVIEAILLKRQIVEYGKYFGNSALALLIVGVGFFMIGIVPYIDVESIKGLGSVVIIVGAIRNNKAAFGHSTLPWITCGVGLLILAYAEYSNQLIFDLFGIPFMLIGVPIIWIGVIWINNDAIVRLK